MYERDRAGDVGMRDSLSRFEFKNKATAHAQ
jgi:hypothetical protein